MLTHVHHINFLVQDLEEAVARYKALLGVNRSSFIFDELPTRNVDIARVKLGETWLVLVQPNGGAGLPAEHLKKHGEGFFLLSLGCDDLDDEIRRIESESNIGFATPEREGVDGWRIRDLEKTLFNEVQIQLTETGLK